MPNGRRVRILCDTERHQAGEEFNLPTALARKLVERGTAEFVNPINES